MLPSWWSSRYTDAAAGQGGGCSALPLLWHDPRVDDILVVGAGLAGLHTVRALRRGGYTGTLTLVGAEPHPPYDRPPLSKAVLAGKVEPGPLPADWAELDVDPLLATTAVGLKPGQLRTDQGTLPFEGLVLAVGASPIRLPGQADGPGSALRTVEDALALRARLRPGQRLVIVGAGWIGAEVATTAAEAGCQVTVVEAAATPLAGALPAEIGAHTARWYAEAGVELLTGRRVARIGPDRVLLDGGVELLADHVLVGVGARPATGWLAGSGLELDVAGAVLTDDHLATNWPGVYAVGDCTAWPSARYRRRLRVEHWDGAVNAPAVAAANLLGGEERYDPVPYFWSDQFGRMLQYAGHHAESDQLVLRGDPAERSWSVCWLADQRLTAVFAVTCPRDFTQGRRLIDAATPVDPALVADAAVPLKTAVLA